MKLLYVNRNEIIIYLPGKNPFTLWHSEGRVMDMLDEFLCPVDQSNFIRLSDYRRAVAQCEEPTQVIDLDYTLELEYANLCM